MNCKAMNFMCNSEQENHVKQFQGSVSCLDTWQYDPQHIQQFSECLWQVGILCGVTEDHYKGIIV